MLEELLEDWMKEELPGRGTEGGVQLQAAEDEISEGGRHGGGHLGWASSTRNLTTRYINLTVNCQLLTLLSTVNCQLLTLHSTVNCQLLTLLSTFTTTLNCQY